MILFQKSAKPPNAFDVLGVWLYKTAKRQRHIEMAHSKAMILLKFHAIFAISICL